MKISLKAARVNAGLTQTQVAEALGKNPMTIASWENGKSTPNMRNLYALCALYKMPVRNILLPGRLGGS